MGWEIVSRETGTLFTSAFRSARVNALSCWCRPCGCNCVQSRVSTEWNCLSGSRTRNWSTTGLEFHCRTGSSQEELSPRASQPVTQGPSAAQNKFPGSVILVKSMEYYQQSNLLYFKSISHIPEPFFIWRGRKGKIIPSADLSMSLLLLLPVISVVAFVKPSTIPFFTPLILNICNNYILKYGHAT